MKRSRFVALISMGAGALALSACEDPNELIDAKAYETVAACVADGRGESDCRSAMATADAAYQQAYPKYDNQFDCEDIAGIGKCEKDYPNSREASWRPSMTGFLIGAALGSRVQPQPLVAHAASPSGRATAGGTPVAAGVATRIPAHSAAAASPTQVAKAHGRAPAVSRGGFGATASRSTGTSGG
jgi:uncharacterized protein YgiB involved in biofilm formation